MNIVANHCQELVASPAASNLRPRLKTTVVWIFLAAAAFHFAYLASQTSLAILLYLFALLQLGNAPSVRRAFYSGLSVGFLIAIGRLDFFWHIFSAGAIALWAVYAFWIGLFVLLARSCRLRFSRKIALCALPFIWCGLEYFRSELYYLRFSWLTPGLAFGHDPSSVPLHFLGTYGVGFLLMAIVCCAAWALPGSRIKGVLILMAGATAVAALGWGSRMLAKEPAATELHVAGVQLEFPNEQQVLSWLNELIRRTPKAELLVLSEYTFSGPPPDPIKSWCRDHKRYLIVGGRQPVSEKQFYNMAFVIAPSGQVVFRQAKSVPIQFFDDGLPAPEQNVWDSPWGKIGICICYDLSYTRVTDRLISQGAQALIVPTMDVCDWGKRQHLLHARIGPTRAAEYRLPIFRLASSGISQAMDSSGHVLASAPFPGDGAIIAANLALPDKGRRPLDRWLAPASTGLTAIVLAYLVFRGVMNRRTGAQSLPC